MTMTRNMKDAIRAGCEWSLRSPGVVGFAWDLDEPDTLRFIVLGESGDGYLIVPSVEIERDGCDVAFLVEGGLDEAMNHTTWE